MRRALLAVCVLAVVPACASAAEPRAVVGCSQQSSTSFPGAYRDASSLVIGPMAWLGARAADDADGAINGGDLLLPVVHLLGLTAAFYVLARVAIRRFG